MTYPPGTLTRAIYWASRPIAVQALENMPVGASRNQKAAALASGGYLLDLEIDVQNADPLLEMILRQWYGLTRIPCPTAADIETGMPLNDAPLGYLPVSTNAADFPPVPVPLPPAPVTPTVYVGHEINPEVFTAPNGQPAFQTNADDVQPDGTVVLWMNSHNNGAAPGFYVKASVEVFTPFGINGQSLEHFYTATATPASMTGVVVAQ